MGTGIVHIRPTMPWDTSYKLNLLQHATAFISFGPVALPDRVPKNTIRQSTRRALLASHRILVDTLLSIITRSEEGTTATCGTVLWSVPP